MTKTQKLLVAAIAEIAVILRVWGIWSTPFWYDESFTYLVARLPFLRLMDATIHDVHPPLFYLLASPFAWLPWQPSGLRLFSVICSLLACWALWRLTGRYNLSAYARILALAFMAMWPSQLYYAQEARMYSLLTWLILELWIAALDRRWWLVSLLSTLALYVHNYAIFYIPAIGLVALMGELARPNHFYAEPVPESEKEPLPEGHAEVGKCFRAFVLPFVLWLPWAAVIMTIQVPGISGFHGYWLDYLSVGSTILNTASTFFSVQGCYMTFAMSVVLLAAGIPTLSWYALKNGRKSILTIALLPIVIVIAVTILWRPIYLNRGLLPSTPALFILLAEWLVKSSKPMRRFAAALLVPALIAAYVVWIVTTTYGIRTLSIDLSKVFTTSYTDMPVVHMTASSVIIWMASAPESDNYVMRSPCLEPPGSLTTATRDAIGFKYLDPFQLPEHYKIILIENIFSTQCDIDRDNRMTSGKKMLYEAPMIFGRMQVWQ